MARLLTHFSDIFEVAPGALEQAGALNISLINDLPLFVDPFLLFNSKKPEYQALHEEILAYLRFLRDRSGESLSPALIKRWYAFPEIRQNWLGFSLVGNRGSGLGTDFGAALNSNLGHVLNDFGTEQITRSSHLEKVCLIKSGVGKDNISDFTTNLIKGFLADYTQSFAKTHLKPQQRSKFALDRVRFNYETHSWVSEIYELPAYNDDFVMLTPKDILTKDDTWINKHDMHEQFDDVVQSISNAELRDQLNSYFIRLLPQKPKKRDVLDAQTETIAKYPQYVDYYLKIKEDTGRMAADLSAERVQEVQSLFVEKAKELIETLSSETGFYHTTGVTLEEARARVEFLKDAIENKGCHRIFWAKGKPIRRESDLQILYRLCWYATLSDVSREVNDGRGPVDFKISRGAKEKALVEFKLASNSKLAQNLKNQTAVYEKASDAKRSLKVILAFNPGEHRRIKKILKDLKLSGSPDIIVIDGDESNKPSGSYA